LDVGVCRIIMGIPVRHEGDLILDRWLQMRSIH
jgi:hypothetical protein